MKDYLGVLEAGAKLINAADSMPARTPLSWEGRDAITTTFQLPHYPQLC
jgi:hypothetical protein